MANDRKTVSDKDRWIKWGSLALILVGVGLLVAWGVGVARTGMALRLHLAQALALADDPGALDPAAACDLVHDLRGDVVTLRRQAGGLARFGPSLGWLPKVGGDLQAAPHLLTVADGLTEAGALGCDALGPTLDALGGSSAASDGLSLEGVAALLAEKRPDVEQALAAVERAQDAWVQVDATRLSPWLAERTALLDRGLPLLQTGLSVLTVAPDLMGVREPRTYLVLALNEDELRPGGGFITGVGEVRLEAGQLVTMTFGDSYTADDYGQPYPAAPEPIHRYMGIDLWVFRDSNWSPDFPTSARRAISLYRPDHDVSVDGVIALDQRAVRGIVGAIGPLTLEGVEEPVTGETIIPYIRRAWAPEGGDGGGGWWKQRKSFMGAIAEVAWQRVQGGQVDWGALVQTLLRLVEQKHLFVYLEHPDAAAALAQLEWDSALRPSPGDYVMVLDANVGYNKANTRVREEITYQVDLRQSLPQATLTLVYTHTGGVDVPCDHTPQYGTTYRDMMDRCYWGYVQVYVPQGSRFLEATRIAVPGEALVTGEGTSGEVTVGQAEEGPWTTLGVMGLLAPSTSQTRHFFWTLPQDVVEWAGDEGGEGRYFLRVQKQPGATHHPLTVQIRLPEGSALLDATPPPTVVAGEWVIYRMRLDRDREFDIHFGK